MNSLLDEQVWLKWMELRVHGDTDANYTGTGCIPYYDNLNKLFNKVFGNKYSKEDYISQINFKVSDFYLKFSD